MKIVLSDYFTKKGLYLEDSNSNVIITITKVDLSEDLRHAKVFLTSIHNDKIKPLIDVLNKNSNQYKYIVGKKIRTKNIPNIRFIYDEMFLGDLKIN